MARDPESGSGTFIFNFLLFPVLLGFFGLAFDYSAAFWAKGALQQDLDAATQSALGQINNPTNGTTPELGANAQVAANNIALRAEAQYARNRYNTPFLACQTGGGVNPSSPAGYIVVRPTDGCNYSMNTVPNLVVPTRGAQKGIYTLTMNVHEETHYMFLRIIGLYFQGYNLRSTATLTTSTLSGN